MCQALLEDTGVDYLGESPSAEQSARQQASSSQPKKKQLRLRFLVALAEPSTKILGRDREASPVAA